LHKGTKENDVRKGAEGRGRRFLLARGGHQLRVAFGTLADGGSGERKDDGKKYFQGKGEGGGRKGEWKVSMRTGETTHH